MTPFTDSVTYWPRMVCRIPYSAFLPQATKNCCLQEVKPAQPAGNPASTPADMFGNDEALKEQEAAARAAKAQREKEEKERREKERKEREKKEKEKKKERSQLV